MLAKIKNAWMKTKVYQFVDRRISSKFQKRLTNDHFSILCSNCIGGMIYHRLGKEFLSPTINLHLSNPDFVELCVFLDYYLSQELIFVPHDEPHPVAVLSGNGVQIPDIKLYFNHAKTDSEAREAWEKRKNRIDRANLYIIIYNLDGISVDTLRRLETVPCRNRVVFTDKPIPEIQWSFCMKANHHRKNGSCFIDRNLFGLRTYEKQFDFVSWINSTYRLFWGKGSA